MDVAYQDFDSDVQVVAGRNIEAVLVNVADIVDVTLDSGVEVDRLWRRDAIWFADPDREARCVC